MIMSSSKLSLEMFHKLPENGPDFFFTMYLCLSEFPDWPGSTKKENKGCERLKSINELCRKDIIKDLCSVDG